MMYERITRDADVVICISKTTQQDFLSHYKFPAERTVVVPHGIDGTFRPTTDEQQQAIRLRYARGRPYFLHVGALVARKNMVRFLEAYAQAHLHNDFDVVLAGGKGDASVAIQEVITKYNLTPFVHILNYVPDGDLPGLYAAAAVLAFPSFYEGFGLPVLEAMACETPVVTANCGGTAEIANHHAVLIDPHQSESISLGLQTAITLSREKKQAARQHALTYTWETTATGTVAAYRQAMALRA
jgi:glycosyltransferase involved in cell wall biosynthesis